MSTVACTILLSTRFSTGACDGDLCTASHSHLVNRIGAIVTTGWRVHPRPRPMRTTFLVDRTYTDIVVSDPSEVCIVRMFLWSVPFVRSIYPSVNSPMVVLVGRPSIGQSSGIPVTLFRTIWVAGSAIDCAATIPTMSLGKPDQRDKSSSIHPRRKPVLLSNLYRKKAFWRWLSASHSGT
jgi:hypothetical protein